MSRGNKGMDADEQARALLDRVSVDFTRMVRRADVDYYLKGRPSANNQTGGSSGANDQIAFYSNVGGYAPSVAAPSAGSTSPVSLVAYRVKPNTLRLERLGKGLVWNGDTSTNTPMVFLPVPLASPLPSPLPSPMPRDGSPPGVAPGGERECRRGLRLRTAGTAGVPV